MIVSFCLSVMANLLIFMVYSFWQELVCWSVGDPVHKCHYILYQTNTCTVQSEKVSVEDTSYSLKKKVHVCTKWCWLGCICWAVMISFWEAVWLCCYCVQRLTTADRIKHYKLGLFLLIFSNHSLWFMSIFVNICGSVGAVIISFLHAAMSRKNSFEVNGSYGL